MATNLTTRLTPEQYLEIEREAKFKHEYLDGQVWPLGEPPEPVVTGEAHSLIVVNVIADIRQQLRGKRGKVYLGDMRVALGDGMWVNPDVAAVSGQPEFLDGRRDTLLNPTAIEVTAPATEAPDRGLKFQQYRSIEAVAEYLLVSSDCINAELYTRQADGRWLLTAVSQPDDTLELQSIGVRLTLADLYDKVDLTQAAG